MLLKSILIKSSLICLVCSLSLTPTFCQEVQSQPNLEQRKLAWKTYLDKQIYNPEEDVPLLNIFDSIERFESTAQLNLAYKKQPNSFSKMSLSFTNEFGEVLLERPVVKHSGFRTVENVLYFVHYSTADQGCKIGAYDLSNGKTLWKTDDITGLDFRGHSAYHNEVDIRFSYENQVPNEKAQAAVLVRGQEEFGEYLTVIDRETGELLARRIFWGDRIPGTGGYTEKPKTGSPKEK